MTTNSEELKNKIRTWFIQIIDSFREEYEKLSESEKRFLTNADDYRPPCQIEVFWLSEPIEYQLIVTSHDPDRPDKEIIINGPFRGYEFVDEIEKIMNEPRWERAIPQDSPYLGAETGKIKRPDVFVGLLKNFVNVVRNSVFLKLEKGQMGGMILDSKSWCWYVKGRVDELDQSEFIEKIIRDIKQRSRSIGHKSEVTQVQIHPKRGIKGYGAHFYPPIWIGEIRKRSFKQKVFESGYPWPSKVLDFNFNRKKLVVNSDGFVGVEAEDRIEALRILNTIFGIAFMSGINCLSARESEVSEINIDPESLKITSATWEVSSLRSLPMEWYGLRAIFYHPKQVSKELIEEILKKAEVISKDEELAELLIFLIEGFTHYSNSEYSQSFIVNWLIVEKYLSELWLRTLNEREIKGKRKDKLTNPAQWSLDYVIETLNLAGELDNDTYKELMDLKTKRNKFVHGGEAVDKSACEKLMSFSFKIVEDKLSKVFAVI